MNETSRPTRALKLRISDDTYERLERLAVARESTLSQVVTMLAEETKLPRKLPRRELRAALRANQNAAKGVRA